MRYDVKQRCDEPTAQAAGDLKGAVTAGGVGAAEAGLKSIFSVDVEDWFHILDLPSAPPMSEWGSLPSRVERNFRRLIEIFSEKDVQVTCFFLGWVAERYPHLVREAVQHGHEIASHGYAHRLVYEGTAEDFHDDIAKAKDILEQTASRAVKGYRSPGFSCTEDVPWFFDMLAEAGHVYDSSVFPAPRGHGGMRIDQLGPHVMTTGSGPLIEFPITVVPLLGRRLCFFGGGYLRLFPYRLINRMARRVLAENRAVVFYVHPREIDPAHPRLPMSARRRFKSYVNLRTTEFKIRRIFDDFETTTFERLIEQTPHLLETR